MADYRFSGLAENDLDEITYYTAIEFGREQAARYTDSVLDGAQFAANFPSIGRPYSTSDGNEFLRYNVGHHAMFFRNQSYGILIARILHQSMDFDRHLDR